MRATALVVEDELKLRELLRSHLELAGLSVLTAATGAEAIALACHASPDVVVLDLRLPDIPGEDIAIELRHRSDVSIVMLTAKSGEEERIRGFELGADDYVTKPFSPRELVLRIEAILRRRRDDRMGSSRHSFGEGEIVIDEERREVTVRGEQIDLTPTEWNILVALSGTPGRVYSRTELINRVRGYEFNGYERTVDSHVKNLRRKVEGDPQLPRIVLTVLGGGYRLGLKPDG